MSRKTECITDDKLYEPEENYKLDEPNDEMTNYLSLNFVFKKCNQNRIGYNELANHSRSLSRQLQLLLFPMLF